MKNNFCVVYKMGIEKNIFTYMYLCRRLYSFISIHIQHLMCQIIIYFKKNKKNWDFIS